MTLWSVEQDFIRLMAQIKQNGIKIDRKFCREEVIKGTKILNQIRGELKWNPGSPKQLGEYLIGELGLPVVKRTPKGQPCFDKFALEEYESYLEPMKNETAQKILVYRGWQKTVSSNYQAYLDLADEDSILHPNYKVHGTVTSRLSCEKPNLQQIPRSNPKPWNGKVKKAFIPRNQVIDTFTRLPKEVETRLYNFDFKQLEFRLAAAYAQEYELLDIFNSGADIFHEIATLLGWLRHDVKTLVYATTYGAHVRKLALIFGIPLQEAQERYDEFHGRWPGLKRISEKAYHLALREGYIEYWTGRRRHLPNLSPKKSHLPFNALIQGGAFEIVKHSMLRTTREFTVLQVHDSVTIEGDESLDVIGIKKELEAVPQAKEFGVKFEVECEIWE